MCNQANCAHDVNTAAEEPEEVETVECEDCGTEIDRSDACERSGHTVCESCLDSAVECDDCRESCRADDTTELDTVDGSRTVCDSCAGDYSRCDGCHEYVPDSDAHTPGSHTYCESCYSDRYTECEGCGEDAHNDYGTTSDCGDFYCDDCYSDRFCRCYRCDCELERSDAQTDDDGDYHCDSCYNEYCSDDSERPDLPSCRATGFLTARPFAVELEVTKDCADCNWDYHSDSSVNGDGAEYCSGPIVGQDGIDDVESACDALADGKPDQSCGFHIHLDFTSASAAEVARFARLAKRLESWALSVVPHSRRNGRYCKNLPASSMSCTADSLERVAYGQRVSPSAKKDKYNSARYHWLNLHSWYYRGTVEIRLHSGTVDADKVLAWAEFWLHAADWAASHTDAQIDALPLGKHAGFVLAAAMELRQDTIEYFVDRQAKFA